MFKEIKEKLFGKEGGGEIKSIKRIPLHPEFVDAVVKPFEFVREWVCICGAKLKIRAREDREEGVSNYIAYPSNHPKFGHSILPSENLNWNGLAVERGWQVGPEGIVRCPACLAGLTVEQYKASKRK